MITCNGSSLGYGLAGLSPYLKTILQGGPPAAHRPAAGDPA